MQGVPAVYLGRIVSKTGFRTFVYGVGGSRKLVGSWEEYERHMQSGLWFSTIEDALCRIEPVEPVEPVEVVEEAEEVVLVEVPKKSTRKARK